MTTADVTNQPLNIVVDLYDFPTNEPALTNSAYQQTSASLIIALPILPSALQAQLAPLKPYLTRSIGDLFNLAWQSARAGEQIQAAAMFTTQAETSGTTVSNVSCTLASSGNVTAVIIPATSATQPATLSLIYGLPGGDFHFYSGEFGAGWKINFDAVLSVSTPVPVRPFELSPSATAALYNASMHTDNVGAGLDTFLSELITDLGNFFTQSDNYQSLVDLFEGEAAERTDQSVPLSGAAAAPFSALFTTLNNSGPQCVAGGISQCAFSIVNNSTLTLTLTHPLDPGPTIENVNAPPPGTVLQNPPALAASASQALPGEEISVRGTGFPVDTTTHLNLEWPNTSTGTPNLAQVSQDGVVTIVPTPEVGADYSYQTPPLQPGESYSFRARCADTLTWSSWGPSLIASTATTNLVVLTLIPPTIGAVSPSFEIGSAAVAAISAPWTCDARIPRFAPPGPYTLRATLAGQFLASTPITVTGALAPVLEVVDSVTGILVQPPIFGGMTFAVRGQGFPIANGGTVTVTMNGATVAVPTASGGQFTVSLTTPGNAFSEGTVTVTATGGGVSASLNPPITMIGQPK